MVSKNLPGVKEKEREGRTGTSNENQGGKNEAEKEIDSFKAEPSPTVTPADKKRNNKCK